MKKLLITCFEPFGGDDVNTSYESVMRLPDTIGNFHLKKLCLPVVFGACMDPVRETLLTGLPDDVILTGQAGGRKAVTPEMYAHNLRYGRIPDNAGQAPLDEPVADGPDALRSTADVRAIAKAIGDAGVPAEVSYSAGAYVCNDLYYQVLSYIGAVSGHEKSSPLPVCFIHVPSVSDGLSIEEMSSALAAAVLALDVQTDQSA